MHLGSFLDLIPHIMKRHPLSEMRPGDVFCGNDAYEGGGTHLPDIVLAEPVFVDGEMIALGASTSRTTPISPIAAMRTSTRRGCGSRRSAFTEPACCRTT